MTPKCEREGESQRVTVQFGLHTKFALSNRIFFLFFWATDICGETVKGATLNDAKGARGGDREWERDRVAG